MKTLFYKLFNILLCTAGLLFSTTEIYSFDMGNLSPEEMQQMEQFEKELMEASKAIEEAVAQMSPEEQEEFNRAVEEMTKILEDMPDDEFDNFLEDLFSTEFDESMFEELAKEMEEIETVEELPTQKEVVVSLDEFKDIITLLDSIAKQLNSLLVKISSSPDIPNKLVRWRGQNKIKQWSNDLSWTQLRTMIETFASTILHMKKVDEKTKKALYLPFIKENKSLVDNLTELNKQLLQTVPAIEIPEFGIEKLSPASKQLLQKAMTIVTESLFITKIPEALAQVEEKFSPEAKKLAEQEEKLEKEAGSRVSRPVRTTPTIVAGKEETGYAIRGVPSYDQGGIPSRGPSSSYRPTSPGRRPYQPTDRRGEPSGKEGEPGAPTEKKDKKDSDKKDTDKDKEPSEEEKLAKMAEELEDKKANKLLDDIVEGISTLAQAIQENKVFSDIAKDIKKPFEKDGSDEIKTGDLNKFIVETIISKLDALHDRLKSLSNASRIFYQKTLQEKVKKEFVIIENLVKNLTTIKNMYEKNKSEINEVKRLYYLLDEEMINQAKKELEKKPEELQQFEEGLSLNVSLFEIQENLLTVLKKIGDLSYKSKTKAELTKKEQELSTKTTEEEKELEKSEEKELQPTPEQPQEQAQPELTAEQIEQIKLTIKELEREKKGIQDILIARAWSPQEAKEKQERLQEIEQQIIYLNSILPKKAWWNPLNWF